MWKFLENKLGRMTFPTLIVWDGKYDPRYYLANDADEFMACYLQIFCEMDEFWGYSDIEEPVTLPEGYESTDTVDDESWRVLIAARSGNTEAAYQLLSQRAEYEYERVFEAGVWQV